VFVGEGRKNVFASRMNSYATRFAILGSFFGQSLCKTLFVCLQNVAEKAATNFSPIREPTKHINIKVRI